MRVVELLVIGRFRVTGYVDLTTWGVAINVTRSELRLLILPFVLEASW